MANKVNTPETDIIVDAKGKLELFFEKYGKILLWVLVVVGIAVGGFFIYKSYSDAKEQERIAKAEAAATVMVVSDSDAEAAVAVADNADYKETASANLANYMAAGRYLVEGDIENAKARIAMFKDFDNGYLGAMINAAAYGLRGDIAVEEDNLDAAIENFKAALAASNDVHTCITYNTKLAHIYIHLGENEKANECYKAIVAEYPDYGVNPADIHTNGVNIPSEFDKYIW
jgi:predicted negative regulator of RcsB-dependent stress response